MIEVNSSRDNVLSIYVTDKLTKDDLDDLVPILEQKIADSDHPHLLMILEKFKGWKDTATFWKDLKFDHEYIGYFDRIAIVGEKKWQQWGTRLMDPITKEELKFFPVSNAEEALNWIQNTSH